MKKEQKNKQSLEQRKEQYIKEINERLQKSQNLRTLDMVLQILRKCS